MGGIHLSKEVDNLIIEALVDLRDLYEYEPSGKQVHDVLIKRLQSKGYGKEIPSLRTVQSRLEEAREREKLHQSNSKVDENQPWNMLALNSLPLPPEAIPYVLEIWRYSIAVDVVFTIRHAKWVSRLYTLYKHKDITDIWFDSLRYAIEENLSILNGTPAKTYHLDSLLAMGEWERFTAHITDINLNQPIGFVHHTYKKLAKDGGVAEEFIHALQPLDPNYNYPDEKTYNRIFDLDSLIYDLPSSSKYFPNFETRMVYLRYLSYIAKMPKWNDLKPKAIRDIIVKLRKLVMSAIPESYDTHSLYPMESQKDQVLHNQAPGEFQEGLDDICKRLGGDSL